MPTYRVSAYLTIGCVKDIEANSEEEAREKAANLAPPNLCHQCSGAGSDDPDEWELNGFDDPSEEYIQDVTLVDEDEEEDE